MHSKPEWIKEGADRIRAQKADRVMEVILKMHEPTGATPLRSTEMHGFKADQFTGQDKHADTIGVSRKVRVGFRRTLQGTLASLARGMRL